VSGQSIRFRLSVQYSAVVFGLGGALLGLVYWAIARNLRSQTMMAQIMTGREVVFENGQVFTMPQYQEIEVRAIESVFNEVVLGEVARFTLIALGALFLLAIAVGWIMSGRALRPVEDIAAVAREIEASDLSRRIALRGPDDELTRLADTFDGMLERLDRAFAGQRRFLADTSHDLRTPLAVIRSNIELVADDPAAGMGEWRQAGGVIKRNAEKMSEMIDGLLATARLQAGKAQAVAVDLAEIVEHATTELESVMGEVALEASPCPVSVQGVEVALDRALSNLLENAHRASPPGGTVRVGSGLTDGWAWLAVEDEGPGLVGDDDDRVGLGLSIVTQIAEGHGGELASFPGRDGAGTTMVVWLPTEGSGDRPPGESPLPTDERMFTAPLGGASYAERREEVN